MINRLISFILFFIFTSTFSFNNEIKGKFIYETDINKNELYLFNNLLELNTYDLETGLLKYSRQITLANPNQLNNRTWSGLYTGDVNLSPDVMNGLMNSLTLKKLKNGELTQFKDLAIKSIKCTDSKFDDNPEVKAYIQVRDLTKKDNDKVFVFNGWMFSSSPSIAPFDHPVYDIWLVKCY